MSELSISGILYFAANLTYVLPYTMTNLAWLRLMAIAAGISTLPYLYLQAEPLWLAIFCQLMFVAINLVHVLRIFIHRRSDKRKNK